jgi:hypothetical protein
MSSKFNQDREKMRKHSAVKPVGKRLLEEGREKRQTSDEYLGYEL